MPGVGCSSCLGLSAPETAGAGSAFVASTVAGALAPQERTQVLDTLHEDRFVERAPAAVYATLLEEGRYLCSIRTMYRVLHDADEVTERRLDGGHAGVCNPSPAVGQRCMPEAGHRAGTTHPAPGPRCADDGQDVFPSCWSTWTSWPVTVGRGCPTTTRIPIIWRGETGEVQVVRGSDGRSGGLAREWRLSGAPVTAFRQRGDGERIPPFQGGRGVVSRRPCGGCPTGFGLAI